MARRLGLRAFTSSLTLTKPGITEFMTHPRQFLRDVYEQLNADQQAALALVYAAAADSGLGNPLILDEAQRDIIDRAGSTPAGAARALQALTDGFLQATAPPFSKAGWAFRHPTLWEGFASWVATQTHLLTVVLDGLTDDALLRRVDCEEENADEKPGTLLRVPPLLYPAVAKRLAAILHQPFTGQKWTEKGVAGSAPTPIRNTAPGSPQPSRSSDADLATRSCAPTWTVTPTCQATWCSSLPTYPWFPNPVCSPGSIKSDCSARRAAFRPSSGWPNSPS